VSPSHNNLIFQRRPRSTHFTWFFSHFFFADGWTTADLVFLWKEGDPVQVVKNLHLPRFTLEKFLTDYCNSKTNTGKIKWFGNVKPV
jgi:hypothetical protein